jgi:hypothetical protein
LLPFVSVSFTSVLRILAMLLTAIAQQSAATLILDEDSSSSSTTDHLLLRFQRRVCLFIFMFIFIHSFIFNNNNKYNRLSIRNGCGGADAPLR